MKKNLVLCLAVLIGFYSERTVAKQIAITFDDAPKPSTIVFDGAERTRLIIATLKNKHVNEAMFFCTTQYVNDETEQRLTSYIDAGYELANHSQFKSLAKACAAFA